ncbi:lysophospholipid acyltransferase family protein [Perlucidibaca piscinae]|uniref:lysophospholipid acyltransferase family protein n=1 Tax=Perlucidibaca piscinae TaxID=392589 RepID=UPI0003B3155F|nr:lysophospholipid acyltransferase family protein [Perlucidibaca piscinae]
MIEKPPLTPRLVWRLSCLLLLIVFGLVLALFSGMFFFQARWQQPLVTWWLRRLTSSLQLRISVQGEPVEEPALWISNHVSWMDIPVLGGVRRLHFLSKAEVAEWPLIGLLAKVAGTLFIRRGSGDSALVSAQMAEAIGEGKRVLFFPEGTTTDGHTVKRFFAKLFQTAHLAGCRIQPMVLCYQHDGELHPLAPFIGDDEMGAHLLNLLALGPMDVTVQFLPVIDPAGHTAPELAIHCEDIMRTALHALHGASPAPVREGWPGVVVRKAAS